MPELPEVETVKRGLETLILKPSVSIEKILIGSQKLRVSPAKKNQKVVRGQKIQSVERKAKYLLFKFSQIYIHVQNLVPLIHVVHVYCRVHVWCQK